MNKSCMVCKLPAKLKCSRCLSARYCCKEHQITHWVSHKPICNMLKNNNQTVIENTLHKLSGNVVDIASDHIHRGEEGVVFVEIIETIESYSVKDSVHLARLFYAPKNSYKQIAADRYDLPTLSIDHIMNNKNIIVIFKLDNYHSIVKLNIDGLSIPNTYKPNDYHWSILYTM